jgi:hypothetical protein
MQGAGWVATRVGGGAAAAKPAEKNKAPTSSKKTAHGDNKPPAATKAEPPSLPRSCDMSSDITGTKGGTSPTPVSQDCKDTAVYLHAARVTRRKYPLYAEDQFKKAAASARRAGDARLELAILREMVAPPPPDPEPDTTCARTKREAYPYIRGAEAIEAMDDATCPDLLKAAENYFTAGRIFFSAIKRGDDEAKAARSCENINANKMFRLRDALIYKVDRKREAGKCGSGRRAAGPPPVKDDTSSTGNPEEDKTCKERLAILKPHATDANWLEAEMFRGTPHCRGDGTVMSGIEAKQYQDAHYLKDQ